MEKIFLFGIVAAIMYQLFLREHPRKHPREHPRKHPREHPLNIRPSDDARTKDERKCEAL